MKILVVTPQPPWPPTHGAAIRNSLFVQALAAQHHVDIVTLTWLDDPVAADVPGAARTIAVCHRPRGRAARGYNLLTGQAPDLVFRHLARPLRSVVQQLLVSERYDAVHLEGLQLAHLAHDVRLTFAGTRERPAIVYDAHNVEWQLQRAVARQERGWRAWYARVQAERLRMVEDQTLAVADLTIACSADDRDALASLPSAMRIVHVPHPITIPEVPPEPPPTAAAPRVLLAANFAYRPNFAGAVWLFGQVWPRVLQRAPQAQLRVVGRASERLRPLAPARAEVGGSVDDVWAEYAAAWLAVSPVPVGAGAPYKVLHAYAAARPAVVWRRGLAGLPAAALAGAVVSDDAEDFVDAVVALLADGPRRAALGLAGHAYAWTMHRPGVVGAQLLRVYETLASARTPAAMP